MVAGLRKLRRKVRIQLFAVCRIISYVEMDITSRCTLTCTECSHYIPLHKERNIDVDFPLHSIVDSIDRLLSLTNRCDMFRLLGGEPFLHPQLGEIVQKLVASHKIKAVQIVTNGTIVPSQLPLQALVHLKV